MNRFVNAIRTTLALVWKHTSAFIALLLIVAALIIGYRIGRPAPMDSSAMDAAENNGSSTADEPQMYTCSMHPSVRLPDPDAKCPICFMDLIPVQDEGSGGSANASELVLSEAAAKLSDIETATVARFFPHAEVRLFGKLTYDETSVARITAYFSGRIDRLFVNYIGVPVARGDHLAEMYSPQLLAAFEELRQARLAVDEISTQSDIIRQSTEATLDAAREKLRLFGLTEEQIGQAEKGEAPRERLTVYSPIAGIVTHLAAREGDYVETGSPIATVANLSRLWLDLEAYESQLPLVRWGQRVTFTVEAHPGKTFDGHIAFIEPLVDKATRTAAVRVAVDNEKGDLKPGMFATATVRPRVASGGAIVSDELAGRWVSPMHPTVVKDEPGECDICGMDLVSAESLGVVGDPSAVDEPLVIPRSAALLTGKRAVVYVKKPDAEQPTYESRTVELGPRAGDFYIVESGLREGDEVVVNGAFRIDSAMQIAAKTSMMTPKATAASSDEGSKAEQSGRFNVPDDFIVDLTPVYAAYLDTQEALADDDLGTFAQARADLNAALSRVDEVGLVGDARGAWRRAAASLRRDRPATTLVEARTQLQSMSESIIALERDFGHYGSQTWHLAFCPMALDNTGAEWMQRGTEINNPYFGASMLGCGEFRESFAALDAVVTNEMNATPADGHSEDDLMEEHDHE